MAKAVRVYVAEIDDLLGLGVKQVVMNNTGWQIIHLQTYQALLNAHSSQQELAHYYQDIMLIGAFRSEQHQDYLSLIHAIAQLYRMPLVLIGRMKHGWFIHLLLKQPQVQAYLHKEDNLSGILMPAITDVLAGQTFLSWHAQQLVNEDRKSDRLDKFGGEDLEVLRYLARGLTPKEIGAKLGKDQRRVYTVTQRLRKLFDVSTTHELMIEARNCGFA